MAQTKERIETHKRMSRIVERIKAPEQVVRIIERAETPKQTVRILAYVEAHYEIQEVPYGKVYAWCPECFLVECECGEELIFASSSSPCPCGADYAAVYQELAEMSKEGPQNVEAGSRPWREEDYEFVKDNAAQRRSYWEELRDLE